MRGPSGGEAVRAWIFANGSCDNHADRFIGYLEKFTPEARKELESMQGQPIDPAVMVRISEKGRLIKLVDDEDWVLAGSEEGQAILREFDVPPGTDPKPCLPDLD